MCTRHGISHSITVNDKTVTQGVRGLLSPEVCCVGY